MSRIRNSLTALLALLMIAAGFLLPQTVLALQDRQLSGRVTHYDTVPVRFYSSRQVTDTLALLAKAYEARTIAPEYAQLSASQVHALALECLDGLAEAQVFAGDAQSFTGYSAVPALCYADGAGGLFSEEELDSLVSSRLSAVVWDCTLTDGAASVRLTVDDATGLVTSVSCWLGSTETEPETAQEKEMRLRVFAEGCATYFADYYGLKSDGIAYGAYPDNAEVFLLTPEAETITLRLTMSGTAFSVTPA